MTNCIKREPARVNPVVIHPEEKRINLDGKWLFSLDKEDRGIKEEWFKKENVFRDEILVPGCWQGQGFGYDSADNIWDFHLEAKVFRKTYHGTGWYGKHFKIPEEWKGKKIWINFGGAHPSCEVYLNGEMLGMHSGPFIPFAFDITDIVSSENDNFLSVRISKENRWLGLAYNWQGYWSGLYRSVELTATGEKWIESFRVYPDIDKEKMRFWMKNAGKTGKNKISIRVYDPEGKEISQIEKEITDEADIDLPVKLPMLWSPDEPNLYKIEASLLDGKERLDVMTERAGFVKLSTKNRKFLINDKPYFMSGTGDFAINPEKGSPDTDRERWRRKLRTLKEYGYNYVRCQSYVPTPEYLDAADEVGLLIQSEMGMLGAWGGSSVWHIYPWPQPYAKYREQLWHQWINTVVRDVNHPSANIYCMSNEIGETYFPKTAWYCYRETKRIKPTSLVIYTDGIESGIDEKRFRDLPNDFLNINTVSIDAEKMDAKYLLKFLRTRLPIIQHEFKWWSSYPDVRIKEKYNYAIRPYVIEIAEEDAKKNNMEKLLPKIARNSQELQYIEAKTKMEMCRRKTSYLSGICHFNAMDAGLSPQGIIDEFYEKKYIDSKTWRQTNGSTVILIDYGFDDRVLVSGKNFNVKIFISDYSHPTIKADEISWYLMDGEKTLVSGKLKINPKPFCTYFAGEIKMKLPDISKPLEVKLKAEIKDGGRRFENQWDFWLFPENIEIPDGISIYGKTEGEWIKKIKEIPHIGNIADKNLSLITETFDRKVAGYVFNGGKVLFSASEGLVRPFQSSAFDNRAGRYFFLPPANYPPYEDGHTGTIVRNHPMLGGFPHQGFCNFQFYRMMAEYPPVDLTYFLPLKEEPIIRVFSRYMRCHQLCYLIEFAYGKGRMIVSSLNFDMALPEGKYLLSSILCYLMNGSSRPKNIITEKALKCLFMIKWNEL